MAITKLASSDLITFTDSTDSIRLPFGTTAQRPSSPTNGEMRYNTDDNKVEYYDGASWLQLSSGPYPFAAYYLVGGGAGGFGGYAATGGAGGGIRSSFAGSSSGGPDGVVESMIAFTSGVTYTITVGAGGTRLGSGSYPVWAGTGGVTSLSGSDISTITTTGSDSRSGGASRDEGYVAGAGSGSYGGGGGGGAGEVGYPTPPYSYRGGNGGDGMESNINGTPVYRAGGAGGIGNSYGSSTVATGGLGGGADAILPFPANVNGNDGTNGLGGGGTGRNKHSSQSGTTGGAGGSGCAFLRMPTSEYSGSVTGSPSVSTVGSDTVIHWTGSGTYTH